MSTTVAESPGQWEHARPAQRRNAPLLLMGLVVVALGAGALLGGGALTPEPAGLVVEEARAPAPDRTPFLRVQEAQQARKAPRSSDTWGRSAPGPLAERSGAVVVRMGEEVLIWGGVGERAYADGAVYDPVTQTWRIVASASLRARSGAVGVWTGTEAVVFGGLTFAPSTRNIVPAGPARDGAAYNPETDSWRRLPPLPFPLATDAVFSHRNRLYAVSAEARRRPVAVLDSGSSRWRLAAAAPRRWFKPGEIAARRLDGDLVLYPSSNARPIALKLADEQWTPVGTLDGL